MRTENLSVHDLGIQFRYMGDMCFHIIFLLLHYLQVHYASRQSASFYQYPLTVAHPRKSNSPVSYLLYLHSRERFRHMESLVTKALICSSIPLEHLR